MAKVKLALVFTFLLSLNIVLTSARASFDDDDDFDKFSDSEEEDQESEVQESRAMEKGDHDHDHSSHTMSGSSGNQPKKEEDPKLGSPAAPFQGTVGGNVAGYNESCQTRSCNSGANIRCSDNNICTCIDSYTYLRSQERCYPIPVGEAKCEFNEQCHAGRWGNFARCNRFNEQCECFDTEMNGKREVDMVKGICFLKKQYDEQCQDVNECLTTMKGEVECSPPIASINPPAYNKSVCRCSLGNIWDNLLKECLKIANQGLSSPCKSDFQCQESSMGNISRCSRLTELCECHNPVEVGAEFVVFYKPRSKCFGKKDFNDTCVESDECKASISSEAECMDYLDDSQGFIQRKTCQCPQGKTCPRDGDNGAFAMGSPNFVTLLLAFLSTLIYFG